MSRRARFGFIAAGIALGCGILIFLGAWSSPILVELSTPDVDSLLREYAKNRSDIEEKRLREQIQGMGIPAAQRLIEIAHDGTFESSLRREAILLLHANPMAAFDILELTDDPDSQVRFAARNAVQFCIKAGLYPRDYQSDTVAQLLKKWGSEHSAIGLAAISYENHVRDLPLKYADDANSRDPVKIFEYWSRSGTLHASSPHLIDLRAIGRPATVAIFSIAQNDSSPLRRSMAYIALGMLGDTSILEDLRKSLSHVKDRRDQKAIRLTMTKLSS